MKKAPKIAFICLLLITLVLMFLPVARFADNSAASMDADIQKQSERVDSAQAKLDRDTKAGKDEATLNKQKDKIAKEQAKLDELIAQKEAAASNAEQAGLSYSLLPGKLPASMDAAVRKQNRITEDAKEKLKTLGLEKQAALTSSEELGKLLSLLNEDVDTRAVRATAPMVNLTSAVSSRLSALDKQLAKRDEALKAGEPTLKIDTAIAKEADKLKALIPEEQTRLAKLAAEKDEAIAKQPDIIAAAEAKLKEVTAERDAAVKAQQDNGKEKAMLELDGSLINNFKVYPVDGDMNTYHILIYVTAAMLALSAVLALLSGNKLVSKCYTFAGLTNLIAIITMCLVLFKLMAFPIKLPYGNAEISPVMAGLLVGLPIIALGINCVTMRNTKRTMIYLFCILLSALAILPFWVMLVNGTRTSQAIQNGVSLIPGKNLTNNWRILTSKNFDISIGFRNSAIIAFSSTILSVYFSALTAYGFTVYDFKGKKFLYAVVMAIIMIPGQVTGTGFFMFMYKLGLTNNFIPLIIPGIAAASTVFFFRQYLAANFQVSLVEAARIDGAGEFYTYNRIVMPIMIPAMATMGIMAIIGNWNNYLTPLMLLSKNELKTLPMMVKELRGDIYRTEFGSIYLGLSLTSLPLIIVYFALSKYIIAGVALGGVKE